MKICHLTSAHDSLDTRILYKECASLARHGYDVYLVAHGKTFTEEGVKIIGIGPRKKDRAYRMIIAANRIYHAAKRINADLYHIHDPELIPYAYLLKRKGKIVIFDSHENTFDQIEEKDWIAPLIRPIVRILVVSIIGRLLGKLDALVTVTPDICERLRIFNSTVVMITNYPLLSSMERIEEKQAGNKLLIGFAGGVGEQWSHGNIIQAISSIENVEYFIWGKIDEQYKAMIERLPGYNQVHLMGRIPFKRTIRELTSMDVGMALCQYGKNMGGNRGSMGNTKLFEYMLAGIPVICTDFRLWQDIIEKYYCGICVNPNNIKAIADSINYFILNPGEMKRMGSNGRLAIENEYNWQTQENVLLKLYNCLLG